VLQSFTLSTTHGALLRVMLLLVGVLSVALFHRRDVP
jgi:hypothetical protein